MIGALTFPLVYALSDAMSDAFQIKEKNEPTPELKKLYSKRWHQWQAARQFVMLSSVYCITLSLPITLLGFSLFWLLQDGILNTQLGKKFFYVGTTAELDKLLQKLPNPSVSSAIIKIAMVLGTGTWTALTI